jgi:endonuclease/exonuclease/phosphatase family metal-dependent hydrolase
MRPSRRTIFDHAPRLLGAFLLIAVGLISGCKRTASTPSWDQAASPLDSPAVVESKTPRRDKAAPTSAENEVRFISYNVRNWLTRNRYVDGTLNQTSKPEKEKAAVIDILTKANPDILGLCEVGGQDDIADLQRRLKEADVDLPFSHSSRGTDPDRQLVLLSRYPIVATATPAKTEFSLNGKTHGLLRGILDATITANGNRYRMVGIHLKSKRDTEDGDQAEIRMHEARLVRAHIESIFSEDPDARLIVYGDFNDTKASTTVKTIQGNFNHPTYLSALNLEDRRGETWTQHWDFEDIYSRFDWIFVSNSLKRGLNAKESRVLDDTGWEKASDHRGLLMILE